MLIVNIKEVEESENGFEKVECLKKLDVWIKRDDKI